jgi:hypothetical protein
LARVQARSVWGRWLGGVARRLERAGIGNGGRVGARFLQLRLKKGSQLWWDENEALCEEKSVDRSPIRYKLLSIVLIRGASRLPFGFNDEDEGP